MTPGARLGVVVVRGRVLAAVLAVGAQVLTMGAGAAGARRAKLVAEVVLAESAGEGRTDRRGRMAQVRVMGAGRTGADMPD